MMRWAAARVLINAGNGNLMANDVMDYVAAEGTGGQGRGRHQEGRRMRAT